MFGSCDIISAMAKKKTEQQLYVPDTTPVSYEMVVVFKPFLPDKVRNDADEKVASIIEETSGKITTRDIWGKRYLAFPIKGHVEGYYVMYQFNTPGAGIESIKKYMNRHQEVIRYLIIKRNVKDTEGSKIKVKKTISAPKVEAAVE